MVSVVLKKSFSETDFGFKKVSNIKKTGSDKIKTLNPCSSNVNSNSFVETSFGYDNVCFIEKPVPAFSLVYYPPWEGV